MRLSSVLLGLLPLALSSALPSSSFQERALSYNTTCKLIEYAISRSSGVFYPGNAAYVNDTEHWVPSASLPSACSVEPGSTQDAGTILRILGATKTPFAIRSGGHQFNPGFSSTLGVQIAMPRFNKVKYNKKTQTVEIGGGLVWNEVFSELSKYGVNVAGGRIHGVGVSGFLLGGGYSWLSNRHGLGIDNIVGYELVLPSGKVIDVSATAYPDLFFGLKGGFSNFGIVTKFVMKAFPQGQVWGGLITYGDEVGEQVLEATADFAANNKDRDAQIITQVININFTQSYALNIFYNGPRPLNGVFDKFLNTPAIINDTATRSFTEFIEVVSADTLNPTHLRGRLNTVSIPDLTLDVVKQISNQTRHYAAIAPIAEGAQTTSSIEPFIPSSIVNPNTNSSAYPHPTYFSPLAWLWFWPNATADAAGLAATEAASAAVTNTLVEQQQNVAGLLQYPNYAIETTPLETLYGENLPRLRALALRYDPTRVMQQAGGWKF